LDGATVAPQVVAVVMPDHAPEPVALVACTSTSMAAPPASHALSQ
jgi:hypothetical protein